MSNVLSIRIGRIVGPAAAWFNVWKNSALSSSTSTPENTEKRTWSTCYIQSRILGELDDFVVMNIQK